MRTIRTVLGLAVLAATACQANVTGSVKLAKGASPEPSAAPAATPTAGPTATPAGTPKPSATPGFAKLQRPAGEVSVLSGSIAIDAAYAVSAGSAVVSNQGAQFLAAGGGTFGGGQLISDKGAGVVASGAGNVIAGNTGNLISDKGAGLISDKGAGYALLAEGLATGTVLPAAGMRVQVRNLADGKPVSLGVGPDNQPVYAVYSNAEGRYELYVPKALERNVLVEAGVPQTADARLAYNLVVSPQGTAAQAIDEDSSLVSKFVRESFRGKLQEVLSAPNFDDPAFLLETFPTIAKFPAYGELMKTAATHIRTKVTEAKLPAAKLPAVAAATADAILAYVDLANTKVIADGTQWNGPADEPAMPAMALVLKHVREGVIRKGLPFVQGQTYLKDAKTPVEIKKPTDLAAFMVGTYLSSTHPEDFNKIRTVFASLDVPDADVDHLFAADNGVVIQLGIIFATDEAARTAVDAAIDQVAKEP